MDELNKRVCSVMELFSVSKSDFATQLGIGLPTITHITSGRNKPGVDILQKILLTYPTLDAAWLMLGIGKMIKEEKKSINIDNELNNIKIINQKLNNFKQSTSQVVSYHKLFMDELRHFAELDAIIIKSQLELENCQQQLDAEIGNLVSKVNN
jgi:transcriptional regulator with XRE-family HTH domain